MKPVRASDDPGQDRFLRFYYGSMDSGKSTLALQINYNLSGSGRSGLLLTRLDRSGAGRISSRIGLSSPALEIGDDTDIWQLVQDRRAATGRLDYLICDEVQFFTEHQVDQLADVVDDGGADVYAFGLVTDFTSRMFAASRRLFELADEVTRIQVAVLCWCGQPGFLNARVVAGKMVKDGDRIVVGDTDGSGPGSVRYQVVCRRHFRTGDLGG